jgi:hypothetical protein
VTKKVDYLIVGRVLNDGRPVEESKKYNDAKTQKKKIMTEMELQDFLRDKLDDEDFYLSGRKAETIKEEKKEEEKARFANEMWTDLYQPKNKGDLVGNEGLVV